jgi:hypothetical protein
MVRPQSEKPCSFLALVRITKFKYEEREREERGSPSAIEESHLSIKKYDIAQ